MHADTRRRWAWAVAALALSVLLVVTVRRLDTARLLDELRAVHPRWIAGAALAYLAILPLWALQWRVLAPPLPGNRFRRMLSVVSITSSTHNTTAFMVGEATGAVLLVSQVGLTRSAAVSVITMDQLLVGIAKLVVLATAASLVPLPVWMVNGVTALVVGVALLLIVCLVIAWRHDAIAPRLEKLVSPRVARTVASISETLAPLRSFPRGSSAMTLALAKKVAEVVAIVCVQHAFGVALPIGSAVLVLAALNLATMVPVMPGNLGVFEAAVAVTYTYLGVPTEAAVGMGIVSHACFLAALSLPGYAVLARSAVRTAVS